MKKWQYITLVCVLVVVLLGLGVWVLFNNDDNTKTLISEELKAAQEYFDIEKNKDGTEYFIYRLKTKKNVSGATIVIPDTVDGIPVTKIIDRENDFASYRNVASIKIGKNIKYIGKNGYLNPSENIYGENIFLSANALISIDVDSENQTFSSVDGVLYNKEKTVLIKYPSSKTNGLNQAITSFNILDTVEEIYPNAFKNNQHLEVINLSNSVKLIGKEAFANCMSLFKVNFGNGLLRVEYGAFLNCNNIDTINLPSSLNYLSSSVFSGCDKLSIVNINSNLEFVGVNLFSGCSKLSKVYVLSQYYDNLTELFIAASLDVSLLEIVNTGGV